MQNANEVRASLLIGLLLAVSAAVPAAWSQGTPAGHYATGLVDQNQYEYVHGSLLYTHDGDDRGWGPEHDLARDNIQALFTSYGLITTLDPFIYWWDGSTYYNVVGEHRGTTRPDEIYILGAHFDSVDNPGADDDATGVAALLEIARLIAQWPSEATIRLIAFDREEQMGIGSYAYAGDHAQENIRAMVSLDMLGYRFWLRHQAQISGTNVAPDLTSALAAAMTAYSKLDPVTRPACFCSDDAPFAELGIPAVMLSELQDFSTPNPFYHTGADSLDTPGYIDSEVATTLTRVALGWLIEAAGVSPAVAGDLNCDYEVDERDVNPFVLALTNPAAYAAAYPDCPQSNGDVNGDGAVGFGDINPLVTRLHQPCQQPQAVGKLWTTTGNADDGFGTAVAITADTALVGAPGDATAGVNAGAAYILERQGSTWNLASKLLASDAATGGAFGAAVALSADTALIGGVGAYVFEHVGGTWVQTGQLTASDAGSGTGFGTALTLDTDTAVIGAPWADDGDLGLYDGAAYVFQRAAGNWNQVAKLTAPDASGGSAFGQVVAISGTMLAVGAPDHELAGAVYVFERVGETWTLAQELTLGGAPEYLSFGASAGLSGNTLVVAAFCNNAGVLQGTTVFVFERIGGTWTKTAKLAEFAQPFGVDRVAIDGDTILAGRPNADWPHGYAGAAYIFRRTAGVWEKGTQLTAFDGVTASAFGWSMALSGTTAIVAAGGMNPAGTSGAAYVFELEGPDTPWMTRQPTNQTVQAGASATFSVSALGPGTLRYQWRKDGRRLKDSGQVSGATTRTLTIDPVSPADAAVYDVLVGSLCGQTASDPATLTVEAP